MSRKRPSGAARLYWTAWVWKEARRARRSDRVGGDEQSRQLHRLVALAYNQTTHYRRTMDDTGLMPADVRDLADLAHFPITDRAQLQAEPGAFRPASIDGDSLVVHSSGSTGQPVAVRYDERALLRNMAVSRREWSPVFQALGDGSAPRQLTVQPPQPSRFDRIRDFCHQRAWVPPRLVPERQAVSVFDPLEQVIEVMNRERPDLLVALGSFVDLLFQTIHDQRERTHLPRAVSYFSDHLGERTRRLIQEEYGIPVFGTYTAVESLKIGYECEAHAGFHLHPDMSIVRIVGEGGQDARDGELGEVVLTNLFNRGTILINYRLGDRGRLTREPCPCGRASPRVTHLEGRVDEVLTLPNGRRLPAFALLYPLFERDGAPNVRQYQAVQQAEDRLDLRVVPAQHADWPALAADLEARARKQLGNGVTVAVRHVDLIPPGPTGKVSRFVALNADRRP